MEHLETIIGDYRKAFSSMRFKYWIVGLVLLALLSKDIIFSLFIVSCLFVLLYMLKISKVIDKRKKNLEETKN